MAISQSHDVATALREVADVCTLASRRAHDVDASRDELAEVVGQLLISLGDIAEGLRDVVDVEVMS